ncbi:MAG: MotA/TolQ/ExbB proton channel family protein [Pirellulales bacterium]
MQNTDPPVQNNSGSPQPGGRDWVSWMKQSGNYVGEHGPEFVKRTRVRGLLAYRQGSQVLATNELSASGVDLRSAIIAISLTLVMYIAANTALIYWLSSSYRSYKPAFMSDVTSLSEAVTAMKGVGWIDPESEAKKSAAVLQGMRDDQFKNPLHRWIEVSFLNPGMDEVENKLARELKELATGSPSGWIYLQAKITTGSEVYKKLLSSHRGIMSIVDEDADRKKLCVAMIDDLVGAQQGPIRWILRINGSIQFATVFVGLFVLTAVTRRYLFITRLAANWLGGNLENMLLQSPLNRGDRELVAVVRRLQTSQDADVDSLIQNEVDRLSRDTTGGIYDLYWFLAGIMPSLGFIGTVVGMSASLMMADRLFAAADRQLAISRMTIELGLAFDTTLVALVFGLLAGIPIAAVNSRERTFFREFAAAITQLRHKQAAEEPSHGTGQ